MDTDKRGFVQSLSTNCGGGMGHQKGLTSCGLCFLLVQRDPMVDDNSAICANCGIVLLVLVV